MRRLRRLEHLGRTVGVREALPEVDRAGLDGQAHVISAKIVVPKPWSLAVR